MLSRLGKTVLWKYADDAPVERLYRHHRIVRTIGYTWITSSILMTSTWVEFMFSKGWMQQIALIILIISSSIALLSAIPGIISLAWASEIEDTLKSRGYSLPTKKPVAELMPTFAMKMCFWFIVLIIGVHLFRK